MIETGDYFVGTNIDLYENTLSEVKVDTSTAYHIDPMSTIPPESYYNQFIISSTNIFIQIPGNTHSENNFSGKFTLSGMLSLAEYAPHYNPYADKKIITKAYGIFSLFLFL
jgi:hypothetical protein